VKRSVEKLRTTAKLSHGLQRNLGAYTAAASAAGVAALALAPSAAAQVVYTPTDIRIGSQGKIYVDFNNDGVVDLLIREVPCSVETFFPGNSLQAVPTRVDGGILDGLGGAQAMPLGAPIGASNRFYSPALTMAEQTNYAVYYYGNWGFGPPAYLGIKFPINGETHYGWARMKVQYDYRHKDINVHLTGFAYETQPNVTIRAGDMGDAGADAPSGTARSAKMKLSLGQLAAGAPGLPKCHY